MRLQLRLLWYHSSPNGKFSPILLSTDRSEVKGVKISFWEFPTSSQWAQFTQFLNVLLILLSHNAACVWDKGTAYICHFKPGMLHLCCRCLWPLRPLWRPIGVIYFFSCKMFNLLPRPSQIQLDSTHCVPIHIQPTTTIKNVICTWVSSILHIILIHSRIFRQFENKKLQIYAGLWEENILHWLDISQAVSLKYYWFKFINFMNWKKCFSNNFSFCLFFFSCD